VATIICGVDVSSGFLDAAIGDTRHSRRVPRTPEGIAELAAFCREHGVELVAMEATGGYERLPFALLWQAGLACALANARQVRRLAEGLGLIEKTDRIDAGVIATFAAVRKLAPQPPAAATQARLEALVVRLRQVTEARVGQRNQRRLVTDATVLAMIEATIAFHTRQIRALEQAIDALLADDPLWTALAEAFRSIGGVAGRTVCGVLALLPEIGTLSNKAVAKLVGLAPIAHDSGKRTGKRPVRGGRAPLRTLLVCVAGIVAKHEPDFIAMRDRLLAAGKPNLLIRVAIARKLLVRLNAKARDIRNAMPQTG
jgi:transposase